MGNAMTLVVLSFLACDQGDRILYYDNIDSVTVDGFDGDAFEVGNLGGSVVTVTGSGFGSDLNQVTVQFGSVNAEVLEVTDTSLTVVTPTGPLTGGLVDVRVASPTGQGELIGAYEYQVPSVTDDQAGYILINDYWRSPSNPAEEAAYASAWVGFGASAEWYDFAFPRAHSSNVGYLGGSDWTGEEWVVEYPAYRPFVQAADDLLKALPNGLSLVNPNAPEGTTCAVLEEESGSLVYVEGDCGGFDYREYDNGRLDFCEEQAYESLTRSYQAEWPIDKPFMVPRGEVESDNMTAVVEGCQNGFDDDGDELIDALDPDCHPELMVQAPGTGFNEEDLVLRFPEQMDFSLGNQDGDFLLDLGGCSADEEGAVLTLEWTPSGVEYSTHEKIVAADTHVRLTVMQSQFGWFGPIDFPIQATITVPDAYDVDPETGRSRLSLPVDVMNQFASFTNANGLGCDQFGNCTYASADGNYGMFWVAATRVTEYRLSAPEHPFNTGGDLVVAYASGTFGLTTGDFSPHVENSGCGNCVDDDGDGWADELDADCLLGDSGEEDGTWDTFGCSDGIDNDGNGLIDAEDVDNCENGADGETNCANGVDDDGDGWVDDLDSECDGGNSASELGDDDPSLACSNGLDDDGDGWIDAADPGCADGTGTDEGDFLGTACNDGIDNDGHYDIDSEDYYCVLYGAESDSEEPAAEDYASACADGVDSETSDAQFDGYWDAFDPACEKKSHFTEGTRAWKSTDPMSNECYDDLDNDGDGATDSEDPGCWNPDFDYEPDGFLQDESRDWGTDCSNGSDDDSDGWVDGLDPDCQPRDPSAQAELGFGGTQCNDGIDNDGDADVDAADSDCLNALDDSE